MPAPKDVNELLDKIRFRQKNLIEQVLERDSLATYDSIRGITVQPNIKNITPVIIHEATHQLTGDVKLSDFPSIIQDLEMKLGKENTQKMIDAIKTFYPKEKWNNELISRFAESSPEEIINPKTPTGKKLSELFAKKYNYEVINKSEVPDIIKYYTKQISNKKNKLQSIKEIIKTLIDKFKRDIRSTLTYAYVKTFNSVKSKYNSDISLNLDDFVSINNNLDSITLTESYANFEIEISKKVNEIIINNTTHNVIDVESARKKILIDIPDMIKYRVYTILRTESQNLRNNAIANTYDRLGIDAKFMWFGPEDYRTTSICKSIHNRTKKGVSIEELKRVIQEEADKNTYSVLRPYQPHINCRHMIREVL